LACEIAEELRSRVDTVTDRMVFDVLHASDRLP